MIYNVGIYVRLSREDGNDESQSITYQKELLEEYVRNNGWNIYDIYVDDGYSGTNFERPGFKRLIKDIENKKINLIITKDLSRLGRNYIYTGYYTEEFFPINNVRYIALNDEYDTDNVDNDFIPFKNIINEWYAKDISKKVRFTLDNKAKKGEPRNTAFPIFGYKYNEKYERVIDEETAKIVKYIFDRFLITKSSLIVSKKIKKMKVKLPMVYNAINYNYNKFYILNMSEEEYYNWTSRNVRDILKKEEYTGVYILGKSKTISFKIKKRERNLDLFKFYDKYQAIISKNQFLKVQEILNNGRSGKIKVEENYYKNILYCYKCNKLLSISRWTNKDGTSRVRYLCRGCESKDITSVYKNILDEIINNEIKIFARYLENEYSNIIKNIIKKINKDTTFKKIKDNTKRIDEINFILKNIYEDKINNKISNDFYNEIYNMYSKELLLLRTKGSGKIEINSLNIKKVEDIVKKFFDQKCLLNYIGCFINKIYILKKDSNYSDIILKFY